MKKPLLVVGNKNLSSWSLRPWLALRVAGVDFHERTVLFGTPEFASVVKTQSPTGRVPYLVFEHEGQDVVVWESLAICETAADLWTPSLWPKDAGARATARAVSNEMHAGFTALRRSCSMNLREDLRGTEIPDDARQDARRVLALWRSCRERYGAGGPFLFGAFSIADAMFAPVCTRFVTYGLELDDTGRAYVEAIQALPAFQQWRSAALAEP